MNIENIMLRNNKQISDFGQYSLIVFMFIFIIFIVIGIVIFAKWLTWGPKLKIKWHKILGKISGNKAEEGIKIKGKDVIVEVGYVQEIKEKIKHAETPQQLLRYQILLENHLKKKVSSEHDLKEKENVKKEKIESKLNTKKLKTEAKEEANILKKEEKIKNKEIKIIKKEKKIKKNKGEK